ncbi:MAG: AsmA family protein [Janthinobacterium lividum]
MPQDLEQIDTESTGGQASSWTPAARRRVLLGLIALLCLLLLVVLPPYLSINRYQRRVASAISGALGRPVHFDNITLHLLPIPGLTIANFVVSENPDFGYEPVLRANSVEARLRVSSLWRRRIEVSRISLDSPSINLVRRHDDGRWNLQSILMQASQMNSAPTAQARAGDAPRFPYIEATDARINIKNGDDKLPFSVKEAEFALWLPEPDQWRLRMVGKPIRTDTDANDVGPLRVEATLGRAANLQNAPIDLSANWKPTPLGEAAKLTAGYDLGWRGEVSAAATLHGTLGAARLVTDLHLLGLHRADYLPAQNAEINAHCEAATDGFLRSLRDVRCAVPTDNSLTVASVIDALRRLPAPDKNSDLPDATPKPGVLLLRGEVPNVLDWRTASGSVSLADAPADYANTWAKIFLQSIPANSHLGGSFDLSASTDAVEGKRRQWVGSLTCKCVLPTPAAKAVDKATVPASNRWTIAVRREATSDLLDAAPQGVSLAAYPTPGGEKSTDDDAETVPANAPISGQLSRAGYLLRYSSASAVQQAAAVVSALGQGVPEDADGALVATGDWFRPPVWTQGVPVEHAPTGRKHRVRR